ncbi:peptidylprolyl isomerase [Aquiluna sp. KACHI24]|uniref:peptidylprolyl isomerase n=1 Tax=Aquiluna sp. KACHI24 TaxID=2968831 RepID=UPI002200A8BE|nr:peptidylprolyl isomerase [Aquiluna sp. KACHI24]BDQ00317.1 hypothetical protein AKACHI_06530 [Aquiluna sp. KACHI24]
MKNNEKLAAFQAKQELVKRRAENAPKDNRLALISAAAALVIAFAGQLVYFNFGPGFVPTVNDLVDGEASTESDTASLAPDPALSENRVWNGALSLNGQEVKFELSGDLAPQAVANFVTLAKDGFYEDVSCHRLTTAGIFVLQCGDPAGDGTGGPGYSFGPIENAPSDDTYAEGVIAMARKGGDGSSMGSQFFIVYDESMIPSDIAGGYTIMGKVTSGLDAVKAIAAKGTTDGSSDGSPLEPVLMSGISVE